MFYSAVEPSVNATGFGVPSPGLELPPPTGTTKSSVFPATGPKAAQPQLLVTAS
jgi:hypothetical protein